MQELSTFVSSGLYLKKSKRVSSILLCLFQQRLETYFDLSCLHSQQLESELVAVNQMSFFFLILRILQSKGKGL